MIPANTKGGRQHHLLEEEYSSSDHASSTLTGNWSVQLKQTKLKTNQNKERNQTKQPNFFVFKVLILW